MAGRANVAFELSRAAVSIGSIVLFRDGMPYDEAAPLAAEYLKNTEIELAVDLGAGQASSTVWTCDLSAEYVRINADYEPRTHVKAAATQPAPGLPSAATASGWRCSAAANTTPW